MNACLPFVKSRPFCLDSMVSYRVVLIGCAQVSVFAPCDRVVVLAGDDFELKILEVPSV